MSMENQEMSQNQQMNQEMQTNKESSFDINNLPPEFQRFLDQQRTQASQTARANARKELMKDEVFLNEVRNNLQSTVQKSVEEQLAELRRETNLDRSAAKVERVLSKAGIPEEDMSVYMDMLVTEDIDRSIQLAESFVSMFNKTVNDKVSKQKISNMQSMTTPQTGNTNVSEKDRLQSAYDELKKDTSPKKGIKMSALIREAQSKGFILK